MEKIKRVSRGSNHSMCVQPTFIIGTYDESGTANFTPITWVSVTCQNDDHYMLVISMFGSKRTKENITKNKKLSVNLVSVDMLKLVDYFGSVSGKEGEKNGVYYGCGRGEVVEVPTLDESKWVYECEVVKVVQTGDSDTYFCDVKNVQVDESIDISGGIDLTKFDPVVYSGHYHSIGEHLGEIGDFYKSGQENL